MSKYRENSDPPNSLPALSAERQAEEGHPMADRIFKHPACRQAGCQVGSD